ncbi:MAG: hypothetical protein C5B54_12055 [Acidobacteria bacterium]|nr:MAG: hypothetical protein C5B54_12055 [Acidobacteriota bacterium]
MNESHNSPYARTITFATIVLVVAILKVTSEVLIPFSLAILLSFLLAPIVLVLQRFRIPKTASVLIATLLSSAA